MLLWNIIRDFFVQYIFGGTTSDQTFFAQTWVGFTYSNGFDYCELTGAADLYFPLPNGYNDRLAVEGVYLNLGDYLSTTATIITLVVLIFVISLGIRWLFRFLISRFTKWGL